MADSKITALTSISTSTDPANDPLVIVDVSDTSMAATGTTKKVTLNNLLSSSPTATGNFTITGDLTVRTNKLKVDASGVGIGTTATTTGGGICCIQHASNNGLVIDATAGNPTLYLRNIVDTTPAKIMFTDNTGLLIANVSSTLATFSSSGNFGIGVTPAGTGGCLQLKSGITFPATQVASSDANTLDDYEEGTFTGTLKGSVTDPTIPVTATGRYTKIGRQVFVQIEFLNFSNVGAAGHITVTGLPFSGAGGGACVGIPFMNKVGTYTGNPIAYLNATTIELYAMTSNSQESTITHNAGTGRYMTLSITYTV